MLVGSGWNELPLVVSSARAEGRGELGDFIRAPTSAAGPGPLVREEFIYLLPGFAIRTYQSTPENGM